MDTHLPLIIGRYELHAELASGGMAVVHLGRLRGDAGFARAVAIKRLHRQYVGDPELSALLLDEARLASRLLHPNVVAPHDLVTRDGEIFVVMDYVHGLTLAALVREARERGELVPIPVVSRIMSDVLAGLHAAHEAKDGKGRPLALVHRDVSPQNVMVGADGLSRVLDFGIAQAAFRSQTTREGQLRAKLAYAAPEHVLDRAVDRRADVYAAAIVCWELLTLERLFTASNESALLARVLEQAAQSATKFRPEIPPELDSLLLAALSKDPDARPASAEDLAMAIERVVPPAMHRDVARWVASLGGEPLEHLAARVAEAEAGSSVEHTPRAFTAPVETRTSDLVLPHGESGATATLQSPVRRMRRRRALIVGVVGLAVVLGVTPALLARRGLLGSRASAEPPPTAIAQKPAGPSISPAAPPPPAADESPASSAAPQSSVSAALATSAGKRTGAAPRPKPRSPAADDCSQLYETDAQGIRRVKRQCLR